MNPAAHATSRAPRAAPRPFGDHLRHWRQHRRLSQLDLAQEADISTRHLCFVETGRSVPSRKMVLRLAERLDVTLQELALETFFPADEFTGDVVRRMAATL